MAMWNYYLRILAAYLLIPNCYAQIIEITDAQDILPYTQDLNEQDLVSFDVKNVLFYPKDAIFHPNHAQKRKEYLDNLRKQVTEEEFIKLNDIMVYSHDPELVDQNIPLVIKDIQKRNIKVIALTSGRLGSYQGSKNKEQTRIDRLKKLSIDFSSSFSNIKTIELYDEQHKLFSVFNEGVLFANRSEKGHVIKKFLNSVHFKPQTIVHIDNSRTKLQSMQKFCNKYDINFIGLHFIKIYQTTPAFNKKINDFKFKMLQENHTWISDEYAELLIK